MIPAIAAHLGIGLGALACSACGKKICRHRWHIITATMIFLVAEATLSVIVIDSMFRHH